MTLSLRYPRLARTAMLGGLALGTSLVLAGIAPAQAATVVGQEFQHANFGGAVLTVQVAPNGWACTGPTNDVDLQTGSMPGGWNDVISSYKNFANCWTRHFQHNNFGGASIGYSDDSAFVGNAMNDQTSSIRWS